MRADSVDRRPAPRTLFRLALLVFLLLSSCTRLKQCAYEGVGRDEWQKPDEVIRALALRPGDHVADLGSGGGYFTFRLAQAVGPKGKVYAVDVDEGLNEALAKRAQQEGSANVEVILAKTDDPLLPKSGVDLIFTSNTYHHLKDRVKYFANAKKYLKPNGRVAIVEFNGEGWTESLGHHTAKEVIMREMKAAGYNLQRDVDFLPRQHFLIFSTS
ncbi:MAG TPA: methyltransferase domain-containing protein [Candidatus Binatia bacterium]|jgi:predicted methyltransferase